MPTLLGVAELVHLDALQIILFLTHFEVVYSFHSFYLNFELDLFL